MPPIKLLTQEVNVGRIYEENGPVSAEFKLINTSLTPVQVDSLALDCGCTSSDFQSLSLAPNDTLSIHIQYDPYNRKGTFRRLSLLFLSDVEDPIYLQMSGFVVGVMQNPEKDYPYQSGNLRFRTKFFNMGNFTVNDTIRFQTDIYNQSEETIHLVGLASTLDFISLTFGADTIKAGGRTELEVQYAGPVRNDIGFFTDSLYLLTSDPLEAQKLLIVTSSLQDYFPPMTEAELARSPSFQMELTPPIDLGSIKKEEIATKELIFTNSGVSNLVIRKLLSNCPCLQISTDKQVYEPGESGKLFLIYDTSESSGTEYKALTLFTNDPRYPVRQYLVKIQIDE
jgi:hypothetical protein